MRTLLLTSLLLAACSGDDDGIGPFPDGGDEFAGEYSATWTPDAPWPTVTIRPCDADTCDFDYWVEAWESTPRADRCDFSDCFLDAGDVVNDCIESAQSSDWSMCLTETGLSGTLDAMTVDYQVILTRR